MRHPILTILVRGLLDVTNSNERTKTRAVREPAKMIFSILWIKPNFEKASLPTLSSTTQ
jgi:hypothetical protein